MKIPRQMKVITTEIEELRPCVMYYSPQFKIVKEVTLDGRSTVAILIGSTGGGGSSNSLAI